MIDFIEKDGIVLWFEKELDSFSKINHFFAGRKGGHSAGDLTSLNLSYNVADDPSLVSANRKKLADVLGIKLGNMVFPGQCHGDKVGLVETLGQNFTDTDALVTKERGIYLCVLTADCVPVLFYDPKSSVIGATHAGWRGTLSNISSKTVQAMIELGSKAEDIHVAIGPSIGPEVFEVGLEVVQAFESNFSWATEKWFATEGKPGKAFLNLWEANKCQLVDIGLNNQQIYVSEICTYSNPEWFFSARYYKGKGGRFASGIIMN